MRNFVITVFGRQKNGRCTVDFRDGEVGGFIEEYFEVMGGLVLTACWRNDQIPAEMTFSDLFF